MMPEFYKKKKKTLKINIFSLVIVGLKYTNCGLCSRVMMARLRHTGHNSKHFFMSRLLVLLVSTVDSNVKIFLDANSELANLYEMSAQYYSLTESGEDRIVELRQIVKEKRAELRNLEVLFQYTKVSFIYYVSTCIAQNLLDLTT